MRIADEINPLFFCYKEIKKALIADKNVQVKEETFFEFVLAQLPSYYIHVGVLFSMVLAITILLWRKCKVGEQVKHKECAYKILESSSKERKSSKQLDSVVDDQNDSPKSTPKGAPSEKLGCTLKRNINKNINGPVCKIRMEKSHEAESIVRNIQKRTIVLKTTLEASNEALKEILNRITEKELLQRRWETTAIGEKSNVSASPDNEGNLEEIKRKLDTTQDQKNANLTFLHDKLTEKDERIAEVRKKNGNSPCEVLKKTESTPKERESEC